MYVVAVPGFVHAVAEEPAIAEPAYFEHFAIDHGAEAWPSDLFFEPAVDVAHHDAAFHMAGVGAYLEYLDEVFATKAFVPRHRTPDRAAFPVHRYPAAGFAVAANV